MKASKNDLTAALDSFSANDTMEKPTNIKNKAIPIISIVIFTKSNSFINKSSLCVLN